MAEMVSALTVTEASVTRWMTSRMVIEKSQQGGEMTIANALIKVLHLA
jgi:hypothetical protein